MLKKQNLPLNLTKRHKVKVMVLKIFLFFLLSVAISCSSIRRDIYKISPVGLIKKRDNATTIEIDKKYEDALVGLNEFSHVLVFYWFHENDTPEQRKVLMVYPRGNPQNPLQGVFATRAPTRPNLIGISLCKILLIKGTTIRIDTIDAFDGSPVIDLKPYIPSIDSVVSAQVPEWLQG